MEYISGDSKMLLEVYEQAIELAKKNGKKAGERIDEEFFEVLAKKECLHKINRMKTADEVLGYLKKNKKVDRG